MQKVKEFLFEHFELTLVFLMIVAAEIINFYLHSKISFLNFFYLPVLLAGYHMGKRAAIGASAACVSLITLFFIIWPEFMKGSGRFIDTILDIAIWAFFLMLTAILIGTLYEQKEKKVEQLKVAYVGILEILSKYLDSYDRYTQGHSVRVSKLSTEIAICMNLPRQIVENIRVAALLHDIGKVDVSIDIIQKSADLSRDERELVSKHDEKGAQILGLVGNVLEEAIPIVRAHHASYLSSNFGNVPMEARIVAVADCYDAMITDRPYRKAKAPWQAIEEIEKDQGKKFDPHIVTVLKMVIGQSADESEDVSSAIV